MKKLRYLVAFVGLAATLVSLGFAGASAKIAARTSPHAGKLIMMQLENRVYALGTKRDPDSFAGVRITPAGKLLVYMVHDHDKALAAVLNDAVSKNAGVHYEIVSAKNTWAELNRISAKITAATKQLGAAGVRLSYWGPDVGLNKVSVTLVSYTSRQARMLVARYGANLIYVRHTHETIKLAAGVGANNSPRKAVLPRNAFGDSSPFNGGDAIWFNHPAPPPIGYDCTSGFPVRDGNVNAVVTAGHCYPSGGVGNTTYTNAGSHHEMGVVNANLYMSDNLDVMEIVPAAGSGTSFDGFIWGDGNFVYTVVGREFPQEGADVFFSGATSGTNAEVLVSSVNQTACIYYSADHCIDITNLTIANKEGDFVCQDGDSGGPVGVRDNTPDEINAAGIIVAHRVVGGMNDYGSCVFQQMGAINAGLDVTVLKGG